MNKNTIKYEYSDQTALYIYEAIEWIDEHKGLREKIHSLGNVEASYRQINHWEEMGLLEDDRTVAGKGWRKFSFYDMTYILILKKLRQMGMPIEKLRKTKESLFAPVVEKRTDINLLEIATAFIYLKDYGNSHLVIAEDGTAHFMPMEDFTHYKRQNLLPSGMFLLNINAMLREETMVSTGEKLPLNNDRIVFLSPKEFDLIYNIRMKTDVKEMKICLENPNESEDWVPLTEKTLDVNIKDCDGLHNLIDNLGYGKVMLTIRANKIVSTVVKKQEK